MPRSRHHLAPVARTLAGLALVLALVATACTRETPGAGKALPEADLRALATGETAGWGAEGKPLVINVWASWCAPCRREMPAFDAVHRKLGDRVAIVGVTDDDVGPARKAAKASKVTYPLLVDRGETLMTDLQVAGLPATVFVDADGTVIGRHTGALTERQLLSEIEDRYGITP